jgi:hypothetical protein
MKNVLKTIRATKNGTAIFCPRCTKAYIVYQFNWKSLECPNCHGRFEKCQYLLDESIEDKAKDIRIHVSQYLNSFKVTSLIDRLPNPTVIEELSAYFNKLHDYSIVNDFERRSANLKSKNCITPKMPDAVYSSWVFDKYELFESEAILKFKQSLPHKIVVRTFGQSYGANVEFYKISGQIKEGIYYVQKLKKKLICGNYDLYCYFMPTEIELDDIRIVEKVDGLFMFEAFSFESDNITNVFHLQAYEKQFEWDGFPVLRNGLIDIPQFAPFNKKWIKETEEEYEICIRPLVRLKKLEKLNSM